MSEPGNKKKKPAKETGKKKTVKKQPAKTSAGAGKKTPGKAGRKTAVKKSSIKAGTKSRKKSVNKKPIQKKTIKKKITRKTLVKAAISKKMSGDKNLTREERIKSLIPNTLLNETQPEIKTSYQRETVDYKPLKKGTTSPMDISDSEMDATDRGDEPMTVVGHLDEMRNRILYSLVAVIMLTVAGFFLSDYLLHFINKPFLETGQKLNIFKLTGGFIIRLKASFVAGLMIGLPFILYQVWKFIAPAISKKDKRFSMIALVAAFFLFYGGMAFVFFVILPFAIDMLLSFIGKDMLSTIGASDYMSFILLMSIAMGVLFELPIIVMILTRIGLITPGFLSSKRKYSIVIIWIIAAVVTPQDILSQVLVAIPLMFLYEISIVISRMVMIRKRKREATE